jgi:RNA polymerase sigma-70 factor (ECF subfamily)
VYNRAALYLSPTSQRPYDRGPAANALLPPALIRDRASALPVPESMSRQIPALFRPPPRGPMSVTPIRRLHPPEAGDLPLEEAGTAWQPEDLDESRIVRSLAAGDAAALETLISRYWAPLTSYASRILEDTELAEDVVQRMFVSLWTGRRTWSPRSVRAYLFRCARNLAVDELRSRDSRHERERGSSRSGVRQPRRPDAVLEESTLARIVDSAIQELPERRREAFVLAYLKQLTYSEVAEVMGVSVKTVEHHVSAALADLRASLGPAVDDGLP